MKAFGGSPDDLVLLSVVVTTGMTEISYARGTRFVAMTNPLND